MRWYPNTAFGSGKDWKLKMHLVYLTYRTTKRSNTGHRRVQFVCMCVSCVYTCMWYWRSNSQLPRWATSPLHLCFTLRRGLSKSPSCPGWPGLWLAAAARYHQNGSLLHVTSPGKSSSESQKIIKSNHHKLGPAYIQRKFNMIACVEKGSMR